jgi:hypothetical protein
MGGRRTLRWGAPAALAVALALGFSASASGAHAQYLSTFENSSREALPAGTVLHAAGAAEFRRYGLLDVAECEESEITATLQTNGSTDDRASITSLGFGGGFEGMLGVCSPGTEYEAIGLPWTLEVPGLMYISASKGKPTLLEREGSSLCRLGASGKFWLDQEDLANPVRVGFAGDHFAVHPSKHAECKITSEFLHADEWPLTANGEAVYIEKTRVGG